jgi:hypothetical protein
LNSINKPVTGYWEVTRKRRNEGYFHDLPGAHFNADAKSTKPDRSRGHCPTRHGNAALKKNVSADEMRRLRLLLSKERNGWLDITGTDTGAAANSELSSPSH